MTTIRLCVIPKQGRERDLNLRAFAMPELPKKKHGSSAPTVRLSVTNDGMPSKANRYPKAIGPTVRSEMNHQGGFIDKVLAPSVRLAHVPGAQGDNNLLGQRGVKKLPDDKLPALLISYVYLDPFLENQARYAYRDWVLDSGAFSAHRSGRVIQIRDYLQTCKSLLANDRSLTEVFSLDVIGDWKASLKNCELMWEHGVPAIPTFHYGEPWKVLLDLAKRYDKIAIGGCVGKRGKDKFAGQCFSRVWPKKLHGFGFGSERSIMGLPWHSVDATNWEIAPCKYGQWKAFGTARVSVRGSQQNLRAEVEWYLDLEQRAREKWKKEMRLLESFGPTVRMALIGARDKNQNSPFLKGDQSCE